MIIVIAANGIIISNYVCSVEKFSVNPKYNLITENMV